MLLLHYALMALTAVSSGQEKRGTPNLGNGPAVRMFEIVGPEGSCTLNPPADNGALCWLSYESEMVGSAGNAPVRLFRQYLRTPDLQSGSRITSLEMVAGVGVAPT